MPLTPEEIETRKSLALSQAEGWEPLPRQLDKSEVSQRLRVKLVDFLDSAYRYHNGTREYPERNPGYLFTALWSDFEVRPLGDMPTNTFAIRSWYKKAAEQSAAQRFYALVDHTLRSLIKGRDFYQEYFGDEAWYYAKMVEQLADILAGNMSPFRAHEEGFLYPVVDDLTIETIEKAITASRAAGGGIKAHFRAAISFLSEGHYAKSAKESWDTLESCVTQLGGQKASFGDSLKKLVNDEYVPRLIADSWNKTLAYANDTPGIRHPLQAGETPRVSEADAIYMLSACGAAVTYLLSHKI